MRLSVGLGVFLLLGCVLAQDNGQKLNRRNEERRKFREAMRKLRQQRRENRRENTYRWTVVLDDESKSEVRQGAFVNTVNKAILFWSADPTLEKTGYNRTVMMQDNEGLVAVIPMHRGRRRFRRPFRKGRPTLVSRTKRQALSDTRTIPVQDGKIKTQEAFRFGRRQKGGGGLRRHSQGRRGQGRGSLGRGKGRRGQGKGQGRGGQRKGVQGRRGYGNGGKGRRQIGARQGRVQGRGKRRRGKGQGKGRNRGHQGKGQGRGGQGKGSEDRRQGRRQGRGRGRIFRGKGQGRQGKGRGTGPRGHRGLKGNIGGLVGLGRRFGARQRGPCYIVPAKMTYADTINKLFNNNATGKVDVEAKILDFVTSSTSMTADMKSAFATSHPDLAKFCGEREIFDAQTISTGSDLSIEKTINVLASWGRFKIRIKEITA